MLPPRLSRAETGLTLGTYRSAVAKTFSSFLLFLIRASGLLSFCPQLLLRFSHCFCFISFVVVPSASFYHLVWDVCSFWYFPILFFWRRRLFLWWFSVFLQRSRKCSLKKQTQGCVCGPLLTQKSMSLCFSVNTGVVGSLSLKCWLVP